MALWMWLGTALAAGGIGGFLAGRAGRRKGARLLAAEEQGLRRRAAELARELQKARKEQARAEAVASAVPIIVRKLGAARSPAALPAIAVRLVKDFFGAAQVGFFAPRRTDDALVLVEGVGLPPEWKGSRGFSAADGMLGAAVEERIVVTQEDFVAAAKGVPVGPAALEAAGVRPDLVIPVAWGEEIFGAIAVASIGSLQAARRQYASMLGDLCAWALRTGSAVASADREAATDHLTRIPNRVWFAGRFETELRQARNYAQPISLLVFDIDHLKRVNDTYGHQAGDAVLKRIAELIDGTTRRSDLFARYGGEEFVVLMTSANKEQALRNANRIRELVASTPFRIPGADTPICVTVSGGVAAFPEDGESTSELIRAADEALYQAKANGRDRIVAAARIGLDGKPY